MTASSVATLTRRNTSVQIIRRLWTGEWTTFRGKHLTVEDARIYDFPSRPMDIVVGISGDASLSVALDTQADGIMAVDPLGDLVGRWKKESPRTSGAWTEMAFGWSPTKHGACDWSTNGSVFASRAGR